MVFMHYLKSLNASKVFFRLILCYVRQVTKTAAVEQTGGIMGGGREIPKRSSDTQGTMKKIRKKFLTYSVFLYLY